MKFSPEAIQTYSNKVIAYILDHTFNIMEHNWGYSHKLLEEGSNVFYVQSS